MATIKSPVLLVSLLVMVTLGLTSCNKLILKVTGNYKKPEYETPASVIAYLKKQDARYDGAYVCRDKKGFKYFQDSVSNAIPSVLVFDNTFTNFVLDEKCPWSILPGLDSLNISSHWKRNDNLSLAKMMEQLNIIDGTDSGNHIPGNYDVYVFYVWAKYAPKLSNAIVKEISEFFNKPHDNIYVGTICRDLQEKWK